MLDVSPVEEPVLPDHDTDHEPKWAGTAYDNGEVVYHCIICERN